MKITIIGTGNVAYHLGHALKVAGNEIIEVVGRNLITTEGLAMDLGANTNYDFSNLNDAADAIILCVKDDAISHVATLLSPTNQIVAHTSGFRSQQLLASIGFNVGIFYPLQTMKKGVAMDFSTVPLLVEGSNQETLNTLKKLAEGISNSVHVVDEMQRQYIHVAAVFANNFTNHLWELSEHILNTHNIDFDILRPLIAHSAENIATHSPSSLQTGPAVRKDFFTIGSHLDLLQNEEKMVEVYKVITESILRQKLNS